MIAERATHGTCWVVKVKANEVVTDSGKKLPYATWLGTIDAEGVINLWYPAAYKPRDYKPAAMRILEQARKQLRENNLLGDKRAMTLEIKFAS